MLRKTKIICTLGPNTDDPNVMASLVANGMDCARMNFSHGDHEEHAIRLKLFREKCREFNQNIPALLDTKGPEIRTGIFKEKVAFQAGQQITISHQDIEGTLEAFSVSYKDLYKDLSVGDTVLIDDGLVGMKVDKILPNHDIICTIQNGGEVSSRKSINVPGVHINLPFLSEKDISDITFGVENDYDFIALSFVQKGQDVMNVRRLLDELGASHIGIISKIENQHGIDNMDDILRESDGIMVARGDLGVEIPVEQVPVVQKLLIRKCLDARKLVITATQMLDSMIRNPRPTRAETSDIANAIFDGTSCIMLSGETANGKYPVESLQTMSRIAHNAEKAIHYWKRMHTQYAGQQKNSPTITEAISFATCNAAMSLEASAIVASTKSGSTVRSLSSLHPECPVISSTTDPVIHRQMRLYWGVHSMLNEDVETSEELFELAAKVAVESNLAQEGDLIVLTAGVPVGLSGTTNMLKVQVIGDIISTGKGIGNGTAQGSAILATAPHTMHASECKGKIVIARDLDHDVLPLLRGCAGVVVERNNYPEQADIAAVTLDIPIIVSAGTIMRLVKNGQKLEIDASRGIIKPLQ